MVRLTRPERIAVWIWIVLALFVGNAIYDLLLTRGIKEYLLRHALHEAGRGPGVPLVDLMHRATSGCTTSISMPNSSGLTLICRRSIARIAPS